jgi:glycosyltransferase involved in cell wall biosynthesis
MNKTEISVVVPVSERYDDVGAVYRAYKTAMEQTGRRWEFVYVLDGEFPEVFAELARMQDDGEPITVLKLSRRFGEATALSAGFEVGEADVVLTLPAYEQVDASQIASLVQTLDEHDMVIARRWPRIDSRVNRIQARVFHGILNLITGVDFRDLGCGVRAFKRRVIEEITLYGDQHRFLPVLASRQGFRVKELDVPQSPTDRFRRMYQPAVYAGRILDILTVFFLVKFTKKPLRFFGLLGIAASAVGGLLLVYVIFERLFFGVALADRPAMLLSSLLVVLGIQIFALGLIGELIIFTHARDLKEYTIEEIVK